MMIEFAHFVCQSKRPAADTAVQYICGAMGICCCAMQLVVMQEQAPNLCTTH